jgi:hypothetical protein
MTMCELEFGSEACSDEAIREGTRRENATRGCGSNAMDEKEDSVAPWNLH